MKTWSDFYPDVLAELPGAPLPVVDDCLRNVAIEFFDRTKAYVVDIDPFDAVADQMAYSLSLPAGTELVEIQSIYFSGDKIDPKSPKFLEDKYGDWAVEVDTPAFYTQQDLENVLLVPAPATDEVDAVKIRAAIKPGATSTGIGDSQFAQWRQAIASGAKGRMMAMGGGVTWENLRLAPIYMGAFEDAIAKFTTRAADGFVRARPRFAGSFC